jgi:DeoR/GlpR family transcriptional regulator of sugar metabolism
MLKSILNALESEKAVSIQEISAELHANPEAIRAGLEYLEHCGYVKRIPRAICLGKNCSKCAGCIPIFPSQTSWKKV